MSGRFDNRSSVVLSHEKSQGGGDVKGTGEQAPPRIEFPCDYAIRIVGNNDVAFDRDMLEIVERFSPNLDRSKVSHRDSKNARYRSLNVTIRATGEQQINALFEALKATGRVQMVL